MLFYKALIGLFALAGANGSVTSRAEPSCRGLSTGDHPHPTDCTKYITCAADGDITIGSCGVELPYIGMWSIANNQCVPTSFSDCRKMRRYCPRLESFWFMSLRQSGREAEQQLEEEFLENYGDLEKATFQGQQLEGFSYDENFDCPDSNGYFGVDNEEASYRICVRGKAFAGKCKNGEVFDMKKKDCIAGRDLPNIDKVSGDLWCSTSLDGVTGFSKDCRYYQVCCASVESMHKCPLGLNFDIMSKRCALGGTCQPPPDNTPETSR